MAETKTRRRSNVSWGGSIIVQSLRVLEQVEEALMDNYKVNKLRLGHPSLIWISAMFWSLPCRMRDRHLPEGDFQGMASRSRIFPNAAFH